MSYLLSFGFIRMFVIFDSVSLPTLRVSSCAFSAAAGLPFPLVLSLASHQNNTKHHVVREYYDKSAKLQYSYGSVWNYHRCVETLPTGIADG